MAARCAVVVCALALVVTPMASAKIVEFSMTFLGHCPNANCTDTAFSQTVQTLINGRDLISTKVAEHKEGGSVSVQTVPHFHVNSDTWNETGTISFDNGSGQIEHTVNFKSYGDSGVFKQFSSVGSNYISTIATAIEGGTGSYKNAKGVLTHTITGFNHQASYHSQITAIFETGSD
eukprot:m.237136 g.237136  ORF g.237136 m.237136 type:complete len:176 (+) comp18950_c0_seq1:1703-2230(+)